MSTGHSAPVAFLIFSQHPWSVGIGRAYLDPAAVCGTRPFPSSLQAGLAINCLGLVTDFSLIRWASCASDGAQGPSGGWSESLTMSSFEKIT